MMSFESTMSLFFFDPQKMHKILKYESWFSEILFELNLTSMESLKFLQKITSTTHWKYRKKEDVKKVYFFWKLKHCQMYVKVSFFAIISQKLHTLFELELHFKNEISQNLNSWEQWLNGMNSDIIFAKISEKWSWNIDMLIFTTDS